MADEFATYADTPMGPAREAYAVAPHATNELNPLPKALIIGTAGDIVLRAVDSNADVTIPVVAGQMLAIRAKHVRAAGTTAGNIVALA